MRFGAKSLRAAIGVGLFLISLGSMPAKAGFIQFSDVNAFNAATNARLIADFEDRRLSFPELTVTPGPNGNTIFFFTESTFLQSFVGLALAEFGIDDYDINFTSPVNAFGFDALLGEAGPLGIEVFNSAGQSIGQFIQDNPFTEVGFFGLLSSEAISLARITSPTNATFSSGIDNVRIGEFAQSIPEPLPLGLTGLGLLGLSLVMNRRRLLKV